MRTTDFDVLRRTDPAAGIADGPLTERELHSLQVVKTRIADQERIGDSPTATQPKLPSRWQGTPRRAVLAGAAVALVAGVGLVAADPFETRRAVAATPPLLHSELAAGGWAKGELLQLAARAARDVTLPGDDGSMHSVRMRSWDLSTSVDEHDQVTSVVLPRETTLVWRSDRSGLMRTTAAEPYFPDAKDRKAWERDGSRPKPGIVLDEQKWRPGGYDPTYRYPLPTDPARLLGELKRDHPIDAMGTQELVAAVTDLYHETMLIPAVRSAVLTLLADRSDVVALGSMTDRAGRTGRAFAVDGDGGGLPTRQVLIVDPTTGALLADEEVLTKTAGRLRVRVPSVIAYSLYLKAY